MEIEEAVRVALPVLIGLLQIVSRSGGGGGASFISHTVSLLITISLVSLAASIPPPPTKRLKICFFTLVLACATILAYSLPPKLAWAPFLSCLRPFFDLLPDQFQNVLTEAYDSIRAAIKRLVAPVARTPPPLPSALEEGVSAAAPPTLPLPSSSEEGPAAPPPLPRPSSPEEGLSAQAVVIREELS